MKLLILLVLLGPGFALAQYEEDAECEGEGGVCQHNEEHCNHTYVVDKCGGPGDWQCCFHSHPQRPIGGVALPHIINRKWKPICEGQVVNVVRGCDGIYGCGYYRAPRPHGRHMGVDIVCPPGSKVYAPFKGQLSGWARAFKKNNPINDGVVLRNSVICIKILLFHPNRLFGPVARGQEIGHLLNVVGVWPGVTSHVHIEMCNKGQNPTPYIN